jgi:Tfp pilus assembly protein FimV
MELMLECLPNEMTEMKATISVCLEEIITPSANQEKMDATIRAGQENMEAVMSINKNVQTEFIKTNVGH